MIGFWLAAGAMLAGALFCVARPLMRRVEEGSTPGSRALLVTLYQGELARADAELHAGTLSPELHAVTRRDIEARLLEDVGPAQSAAAPAEAPASAAATARSLATRAGTAALLIALIPAGAFALYLQLGAPAALMLDDAGVEPHEMTTGSVELMVSRLAMRLRDQPDDAPGWSMLARSYQVLERPDDAAAAYARAVALAPGDAQLRADYADALASAQDGSLAGPAQQQIDAALAIDPTNPKALALAGSAAQDRRDFGAALGYWQRLEASLAPDSPAAEQARRKVEETRARLAGRAPAK
jgi:cytochrome c-type biogenesis protein CcmH